MTEPTVSVVMGSDSDLDAMMGCFEQLRSLEVPWETRVLSCHRSPDAVSEFARAARDRGIRVIVAAAGGSAGLPGVIAAQTTLPVVGVPLVAEPLRGVDALYSIVQMPPGVAVGTMAVGTWGARNAAIYAASILALDDADLAERLAELKASRAAAVTEKERNARERLADRMGEQA